ncbi:MAG TPA: hypothetical protein VGG27_18800 [Magnetospirillaceae bacterium]
MSARSGKAKSKPRRKAGRASQKRRPRKLAFKLTIEAQEMRVVYTPGYTKGEFALGHFEFKSPHRPARRIVVSETGYRSHFAAMDVVRESHGPRAYARDYALGFLRQGSKADARQLSMF